jgi:hypothetical protein
MFGRPLGKHLQPESISNSGGFVDLHQITGSYGLGYERTLV